MDYLGELLAFGVDALLFGVCSKLYLKYSFSTSLVERAQRIGINPDFYSLDNEAKKYVIYQGSVKALGKPINGLNALDITGVVQKLTIKEHAITRNASGFWSDQKNVILESYNVVPFIIHRGKFVVHILDPLDAEILDLDTIHNKFENTSLGFIDHVIGFFNGVRQRGIETTEELLKEGSVMTVAGEISRNSDGDLELGPSTYGFPYFITSMPVSSLLKKLEENRTTYKWLTYLFGGIGLIISVLIAKRWYTFMINKMRDEDLKRKLEKTRKERRKNARSSDTLSENEKCVVCKENPKEVILLYCGHVCICEDCSDVIKTECPICRSAIAGKSPAFIS